MEKNPTKLRILMPNERGKLTEMATMEWDGNRWYIYGRGKEGIKEIIGDRGMRYGKRTYTVKDHELYKPLMMGYSAFVVEVIE